MEEGKAAGEKLDRWGRVPSIFLRHTLLLYHSPTPIVHHPQSLPCAFTPSEQRRSIHISFRGTSSCSHIYTIKMHFSNICIMQMMKHYNYLCAIRAESQNFLSCQIKLAKTVCIICVLSIMRHFTILNFCNISM